MLVVLFESSSPNTAANNEGKIISRACAYFGLQSLGIDLTRIPQTLRLKNSLARFARLFQVTRLPLDANLHDETEISCWEATNQRKDSRQIARRQAIPGCECRGVLLHRSCRNPATARCRATIGIIRPAQLQRGIGPVESITANRTAHNQVVIAPGVIATHLSKAR